MVVLEDGVGDTYFTLTRLGMGILKTQSSLKTVNLVYAI